MVSFTSVMVGTDNFEEMVEFYSKVFNKKPDWQDDSYAGFDSGGLHFMIGSHDKISGTAKEPARLIINLTTDDVEGEFDRLKDVASSIVAEPYHPGGEDSAPLIATLEDPDGNYFQLMNPMDEDLSVN